MSTATDPPLSPPLSHGSAQPWARARFQPGASRDIAFYTVFNLGALLLFHMLLALVMDSFRAVATVHAIGSLLIAVKLAGSRKTHDLAIYACGYIATADVLWRMTKSMVFWEFGKYAVVAVMGLILVNQKGRLGLSAWGLLYFALLMPSVALAVGAQGLTNALRQDLSFNLSGPFSLALAVVFLSGYTGKRLNISKLLVWMLMPIVSAFTLALYSTLTATRLNFANAANFVASGGFGPNQVSTVLGLGVVISLVLATQAPNHLLRLAYLGLAAVLSFQAVLTFSRGGLFNATIALALLGMHNLQNRRIRQSFIAVMVAATAVGVFILLPQLTEWTGGKVTERFTSLDTTGRQTLAEADLQLFKEHMLLGVGPGQSRYQRRAGSLVRVAAHTEFTRLLAEHGVFGVAALFVLILIALQAYKLAPTALAKGWVAGMASWALVSMTHAGMRVAAMSFVFGLAVLPFHYWRRQERALQNRAARNRAAQDRAAQDPSTP